MYEKMIKRHLGVRVEKGEEMKIGEDIGRV